MTGGREDEAQAAFRDAQERWRAALEAHRSAPPDSGFSARLAGLAEARRAAELADHLTSALTPAGDATDQDRDRELLRTIRALPLERRKELLAAAG
jgi:hypothetical protein